MKYLVNTEDYTSVIQEGKDKIVFDKNLKKIYRIPKYSNAITVTIDGMNVILNGDKTFGEQGYDGIIWYEDCGWKDLYASDIYPNESFYYYTTDPTVNTVTVTIDDTETMLDANRNYSDNGYSSLYTQSGYTDYYGSSSDYEINTNDVNPSEGDVYYTYCEYIENNVTVFIDDAEVSVDANRNYNDNGYNPLYTQSGYTDYYNETEADYSVDIDNIFPSEGDVYYTSCEYVEAPISIIVDGEEVTVDANKYLSSNGYETIYEVGGSMSESMDSYPQENTKYSTVGISVQVDYDMVILSPYYTFEEQGYTSIFGKDNCSSDVIHEITSYPTENWYYDTEEPQITVTIDNENVELYQYRTFSEQGYEDIYKEVNGEDIDCPNEYPKEGIEYWTT